MMPGVCLPLKVLLLRAGVLETLSRAGVLETLLRVRHVEPETNRLRQATEGPSHDPRPMPRLAETEAQRHPILRPRAC